MDFNQLENGLLGITVQGKYRIEVLDENIQEDGLRIGTIFELGEEEESVNLKPSYTNIWNVLEDLSNHYPSMDSEKMSKSDQWLKVGTLVAAQGLKGELRVNPSSDFPERFTKPGQRWLQSNKEDV